MKDKEKSVKRKILDILGKNKYLLLVVLAGAFLILLPVGGGAGGKPKDTAETADEGVSEFSVGEQEKRISEALSQIDGAGKVTVVLTLKSSAEQVLATDRKNSGKTPKSDTGDESFENSETTVVITAGSQIQNPVTLKYIYPEYLGALVVAEGADNATVRLELLEAVAGLTGLGTDKITVTKMKIS